MDKTTSRSSDIIFAVVIVSFVQGVDIFVVPVVAIALSGASPLCKGIGLSKGTVMTATSVSRDRGQVTTYTIWTPDN